MKRKLNVGIIGCGRIAGWLQDDPFREGIVTHVAAYQSFPKQVKVVACASRTSKDAKAFSRRFNIPKSYASYTDMLQSEQLDLVSICAYTESRFEMAKAAIEAGVKGIFLEKPVGTSLQEIEKLIRLANRKKVCVVVNHTRRWGADYQTVKRLIDQDKIGKVQSVTAYCSGSLFHTGTHMFDVLQYFFGKPKAVFGKLKKTLVKRKKANTGSDLSFQDYDGVASFTYPSGLTAQVVGTTKNYFQFEFDIQGARGRIRIGNHLLEYYQSKKSKHYSGFYELEKKPLKLKPMKRSALEEAVWELIQGVKRGRETSSSLKDAKEALEMAFGVIESHKHKKEIPFPLKEKNQVVLAR